MSAQSLLPKVTASHATVVASASAVNAVPGGSVTLRADVAPNPSIHIYAAGAKDFTPVSLVITPNATLNLGKATYPKPERAFSPGSADAVPLYRSAFRITMPVTIKASAKSGDIITVGGAVNYQACDDLLCYPVSSAGVSWQFTVK
ncbi:MAG: protein-disulfide reductase DsbD domain-containing protein [Vicinamibacterales bacterium]